MIASTPAPPYYAVIFTSIKSASTEGYNNMADRMVELATTQPGFLGMESVRDEVGITVSYWKDTNSILQWKQHAEHLLAQQLGRNEWYKHYKTRVCLVERDYEFERDQ